MSYYKSMAPTKPLHLIRYPTACLLDIIMGAVTTDPSKQVDSLLKLVPLLYKSIFMASAPHVSLLIYTQ